MKKITLEKFSDLYSKSVPDRDIISVSFILCKFHFSGIHYFFEQARISAPKGFIEGAWKSLVDLVSKYTQHYATLKIWAGPVWDNNNDGLADVDRKGQNASHVFVVLLRCSGGEWETQFTHCKDETKTRVLSIVLPLIEKDDNCLVSFFISTSQRK